MSKWIQHRITDRVREILRDLPPNQSYPIGRPFMTAYQLVIEFGVRFPMEAADIASAIGGQGEGPFALTNYLPRWLADGILHGRIVDIEHSVLTGQHIKELKFEGEVNPTTKNTYTMFRLTTTNEPAMPIDGTEPL